MSVWHWLVILVVIAIPAFVIWQAAKSARSDRGTITPGFKGWLLLLAVGQWLLPLRQLSNYGKGASDPNNVAAMKAFPLLNTVDLSFLVVSLFLAAVCLFLMHTRRRMFRTMFTIQYAWNVIALPASVIAAVYVLSVVYRVDVPNIGQALAGDLMKWVAGTVIGAIWIVYVYRSGRSAVTFTK